MNSPEDVHIWEIDKYEDLAQLVGARVSVNDTGPLRPRLIGTLTREGDNYILRGHRNTAITQENFALLAPKPEL